jgi:hypothetical protein
MESGNGRRSLLIGDARGRQKRWQQARFGVSFIAAWLGVVAPVDGDWLRTGTVARPVTTMVLVSGGGEAHSEKGAKECSIVRWLVSHPQFSYFWNVTKIH